MVYSTRSKAVSVLADLAFQYAVVIADLEEHNGPATVATIEGLTILEVGIGSEGGPLRIRHPDADEALHPDQIDVVDALVCARRLAAYRAGEAGVALGRDGGSCWSALVDIDDVECFDPIALWRAQNRRLCAPMGTTADGARLELDIKEPAENGMGPHGLCIGATGSGKPNLDL